MEYEHSLVKILVRNSKVFHSYITNKVRSMSVGPLRCEEQIVNDPQTMANRVGTDFASV